MPRPFGNDFIVGTPKLDQLHNQLYQEQKNRELQRQRDLSALDEEFTRNVANIKDADVDDVAAAYNDYKQATQQLMRQKGTVSPQQQLEVLRKKAKMYKDINESKQEKEDIKLMGKGIASDTKGIYDTGAAARLQARLRTPTSQYGKYTEIGADGKPVAVDLRDANGYLYKLGASDFSKDLSAAAGTIRDLTPDEKIVDPKDPLGFVTRQYKGRNNGIEFYQKLLPSISGSKEQKDFVLRTEMEYPPEKAAALEDLYKQRTSDPSYRKRYGLKDGDEIPLSAYDTPVSRAVRLKAMEHVVNSPVTSKDDKYMANKSAIMDRTEAHKEKMFQIAEGGRNYRASLNRVRPNLGDYDILSIYDPKVQEVEIEVESPTEKYPWGKPKKIKQKANIIYTKDIDGNDEKYFEGANPIKDKNGSYYIQRSDGDYEGANGKVIQRKTAAIKFMGNPAAYKGGVVNTPQNKTNNTPSNSKKVVVVLPDGRRGEIPENQVSQFLKDNPKAKRQ